jgi:V8-like Glu-specific endopeptidase
MPRTAEGSTEPRRPGSLRPRRIVAGAFLAAAAAMAIGAAAPASAQSAPAAKRSAVTGHSVGGGASAQANALRVATFWTPARLKAARNLDAIAASPAAVRAAQAKAHPDGPAGRIGGRAANHGLRPLDGPIGQPWPGSSGSAPATTTGKVFFTDHLGGWWQCSASTVNSNGLNVVFTAGHCVFGTAGGELPAGETWHSNWEFIPDYNNGSAPIGVWTANQLWTLTNYVNNGDFGDDMGAAVMNTNNGRHIVNVVGGQGFAWNWGANLAVDDLGYPAQPPFTGGTLEFCTGTEYTSPFFSSTIGLACNFNGGSSGGPWLAFFNGTWGDVNGVNSYTDSGAPGNIFSPYFGNNAINLYNAVANL